MVKQIKTKSAPNEGKEKKKKFDNWGYYLAWLGFAAIVIGNIHKLLKGTDSPKKDDYYV